MGIGAFIPLVQSEPFDLKPTAEARVDLTVKRKCPLPFTLLKGRVTAGCTKPVGRATVKVLDACYNPVIHTITDEEGRYCFAHILRPGEYKVLATADRFLTSRTIDVMLRRDVPKIIDIPLSPDPSADEGAIYGTVSDAASGAAIRGTQIVLLDMCENPVAKTVGNAHGQYLLCGVPPGDYSIAARREGYFENTILVMVVEGISTKADIPLTIDPKTVCGTVSGIIRPYHSLYDGGDGAYVGLYQLQAETETLVQVKKTNAQGAYLFADIPPGQYLVKANSVSGERKCSRRYYLVDRAVIEP